MSIKFGKSYLSCGLSMGRAYIRFDRIGRKPYKYFMLAACYFIEIFRFENRIRIALGWNELEGDVYRHYVDI